MNIVWVASEAFPFVKTGGLGDVCRALPEALAEIGHDVTVIMPYYAQVRQAFHAETRPAPNFGVLGVPMGWDNEFAALREYRVNPRLIFYFIEFNKYYDRPFPYDYYGQEYGDNAARFAFLSRGAMQAIIALKLQPDVIHANDWQSALCCVYPKSPLYRRFPQFETVASVLTIHNIGYQGCFDKRNFYYTGLGWEFFNYTCLEYYDQVNFLKGGIMTADMVNTVSPTYAKEILSPEYGFTLDGPLRHVNDRGRLRGILNGIDVNIWDPSNDSLLPARFSAEDFSGKAVCKATLQKEFSLPEKPKTPIFGLVTRLAHQKGVDIFVNAIWDALRHEDVQFVVLASGDSWLERRLSELAEWFPEKFATYIGFNNYLSHLVEAGSDFFVMPSRYEPCGLNQMYSMRYGTVPIARATGGLADTVIDYSPKTIRDATGFTFHDLYPEALRDTLGWAATVYRDDPDHFHRLALNGMKRDFSWRRTATEYEKLYADAITARQDEF